MAFWRCVDRDKQRHATEDDIVVFMNLNSPTNVLIFCSAVPPPPPPPRQNKAQVGIHFKRFS